MPSARPRSGRAARRGSRGGGAPAEHPRRARLRPGPDRRLLKGSIDRGIEPRTGAAATELMVEDGRVVGVRFDSRTAPSRCGPAVAWCWPPAASSGTGSSYAASSGAADPSGLGADQHRRRAPHGHADRRVALQHARGVVGAHHRGADRGPRHHRLAGQRRTHQAALHHGQPARRALHQRSRELQRPRRGVPRRGRVDLRVRQPPGVVVFDRFYLDKYGLARLAPGTEAPTWIVEAPTLAALADASACHRGRWRTRWPGGTTRPRRATTPTSAGSQRPRPLVGRPLRLRRPSHARPDRLAPLLRRQGAQRRARHEGRAAHRRDARVLDLDGHPIVGLYAAGNVMGSVMGMTYGGAGGTLGPGMVFGFLAGRHAAGDVAARA